MLVVPVALLANGIASNAIGVGLALHIVSLTEYVEESKSDLEKKCFFIDKLASEA